MAGNISRNNGKKGGRPKGKKNQATLDREAALERFQERVRQNIDPLFDAQYRLAHGCSYLFRVDEEGSGNKKIRKHILVTDPDEIRQFLDDEVEEEDYYYITTESPDNNALRDMLDRAFGKPSQTVAVEGDITHKFSLDDLGSLVAKLAKEKQQIFYAILAEAVQQREVSGGKRKV